jgi:peptidoglycan/xylan/chitin deacetylase (PgdA/CDA1 family)
MDLRLDRLATLYLASPFTRSGGGEFSLPILMYHSVSDEDESRSHAYFRTCTSPNVFAEQMAGLNNEGYTPCGLALALNYLQSGTRGATKPVVITFDDGYADFYREAFPVLHRYGFSATVFLPTAFIGDCPVPFKGKDCLTWREVRELSNHGIAFGSHTVTHPQLRALSASAINEEIVSSKKTIEERIGRAVESFAYPFAFPQNDVGFVASVRESLESAGYENGVCTIVGRGNRDSDPFFLERLPVNSSDDARLFQAKLAGAYDWIATPQRLVKMAKSCVANLW